jgi:predicted phosphoribosyltransferase
MRFHDRKQGGALLAKELRHYANHPNTIVIALPRGGVVTGAAIADALSLPLDVLVVRKLGTPGHPELAMGAVGRGGVRVLNDEVVRALRISPRVIEAAAEREEAEAERREAIFRSGRPPLAVAGKTIIIADDGLATGSTMLAAIECLKAQKPARIVVAVPVAPPDTCRTLRPEVDELVCLSTPSDFMAVGEWYDEFAQVADEAVVDLLNVPSGAY